MQESPEEGESSFAMFCGYSLQFQIAALGTMRVANKWHGHSPRVESNLAVAASPGTHPHDPEQIVTHASASGSPAGFAQATGTGHFGYPNKNYFLRKYRPDIVISQYLFRKLETLPPLLHSRKLRLAANRRFSRLRVIYPGQGESLGFLYIRTRARGNHRKSPQN